MTAVPLKDLCRLSLAVRDAWQAAQKLADQKTDGGGSCNQDNCVLFWQESWGRCTPARRQEVLTAVEAAGGSGRFRETPGFWRNALFLHVPSYGQGGTNTACQEAAREALAGAGFSAAVYYAVD